MVEQNLGKNEYREEDEIFLKKREQLAHRIKAQVHNFREQYSIFNDRFEFKKHNICDWVQIELEKTQGCRELISSIKAEKVVGVSSQVGESHRHIVDAKNVSSTMKVPKVKGLSGIASQRS